MKKYDGRHGIAVGLIGQGVVPGMGMATPEELYRDLRIAQEEGVDTAYVFRLGGLKVNKEYRDAIASFAGN